MAFHVGNAVVNGSFCGGLGAFYPLPVAWKHFWGPTKFAPVDYNCVIVLLVPLFLIFELQNVTH
jgi:hypothetical protein